MNTQPEAPPRDHQTAEILGYSVRVCEDEETALGLPIAYELQGPRGARYGLVPNRRDPSALFVVNLRWTGRLSQPTVRGYSWFTDRRGTLEPVNLL